MRLLHINKRTFKYQNATGVSIPKTDENGYITGEYDVEYGEINTARANIAPASGVVSDSYFGADIQYDRVIAAETDFGMDERSRLWIDDLNAEYPDYKVKRIARSINSVLVAVSKVPNNG